MKIKILVLFYSSYGHIYEMAKYVTEGAQEVADSEVKLMRVPETLSPDILRQSGSWSFQQSLRDIPVADINDLREPDAVIFGTPTRYGNMISQMRNFLDATGPLWAEGALVGKVGSVFTSSNTQHGGQESTILSFHITLLHLGFIIAGLPYTFPGQSRIDMIAGCSPYGASTIAGPQGQLRPNEIEKDGARYQGRHVASIARRFKFGG
jgi:NAD(P)H dehydrogenase (quinone)